MVSDGDFTISEGASVLIPERRFSLGDDDVVGVGNSCKKKKMTPQIKS